MLPGGKLLIPGTLLTRRAWLTLASAIPALGRTRVHSFRHDFVLGTSLDLTVTGVPHSQALAAEAAVLDTVERLRAVLDTRNPDSEIRRPGVRPSADLQAVLDAYALWEQRTGGVIRFHWDNSVNVDALGKAYIVDRAAEAAHAAALRAAILLDIGGDIRSFGPALLGTAPWEKRRGGLDGSTLKLLRASERGEEDCKPAHVYFPFAGTPMPGAQPSQAE